MFNAQYLFHANSVYSPWMERQGDYIRVTGEVISINAPNLKVELFTKNREDPGDGVDADDTKNITFTTAGTLSEEWGALDTQSPPPPGVLELVRYKITGSGSAAQYALFRMLEPVWFDAVKA